MIASVPARLFSKQAGKGPATVVFLHGFGGTHAVWDDIAATFAATHLALAYDLPGHGGSLRFENISAKSAARAVLADLEAHGVERAHIVGHSLGGAVATLMAAIEPARTASLTLLAPGGYGERINGNLLQRYARADSAGTLRAALRAMSGDDVPINPETIDALVRMRALDGQIARLTEIATAISRDDRQGMFPADMVACLGMPVTIVWGAADPVLPYEQTASLPQHYDLVTLPGAGHMLIEERPLAVIEAIKARIAAV